MEVWGEGLLGEAVVSRRGGGDRMEKVSGDKNKDSKGGNSISAIFSGGV